MRLLRVREIIPHCALAAVALAAAPLAAQPVQSVDPAVTALAEQLERTADPAARLAIVDRALALLVQPTPQRGIMLCTRADVLRSLRREAEARRTFEACRVLLPNDPYVLLFAAYFDMTDNRPVEAASQYRRIAALQPGLLRQVPVSTIEGLIRMLRYQQREDVSAQLVEALVAANYGSDDPEAFSSLVVAEARRRASNGKPQDAVQLLPSILDPAEGVGLLIDRRFEPIWPDIERWAGPAFATQRSAYVEATQARFATSSTPEALRPYAEALDSTGRRTEAIALLRSWMTAPARDEDDRWEMAMATVRLGRLLVDDGQRKEAIALMRAALEKPNGDVKANANIMPNYVTHLLLAQDYRGALAALDKYTPKPAELEAPAASGYFVALRACALAGDARAADALLAMRQVRTTYAVNKAAGRIATACTGTLAEQVSEWTMRVDDPETRGEALAAFATARQRADAGLPFDTIAATAMRRVIDDPGAQKTYLRHARAVPASYRLALVGFNEPGVTGK